MGSRKNTTEQSMNYNTQSHSTETRNPFTSEKMKNEYNDYLDTAKNNYANTLNSTNKLAGLLDQKLQ